MRTEHVSMRLDSELLKQVEQIARREDRPKTYVLERLLDEGLRMQRHPGIVFSHFPSGRRARIAGTGLAVWEVIRLWQECKKSVPAVLKVLSHLTRAQVEAALAYYREYPDEIDKAIKDNTINENELVRQYASIRVMTIPARKKSRRGKRKIQSRTRR